MESRMSKTRFDRRRPDIQWALAHGWEFTRYSKSGHLKFVHTRTGATLSLANTPSDYRGAQNAIARIRRKTPQAVYA